jgi:hypothetical protein
MTRSHKVMGRSLIGGDLPTGRRHFAGNLHLGSAFQDNRVVPTVRFTIGFKAGDTYELDHHAGVFLTNAEPAKFHCAHHFGTPNGNDYRFDLLGQCGSATRLSKPAVSVLEKQ